MSDNLKVLLTTEGTFPFQQGGVSTWCDILVKELHGVDFTVYSVMMNPFVTQKFELPDRTDLVKMPLWGTEEPCEHLTTPFSLIYLKKQRTLNRTIKELFLPLFTELIEELISPTKNSNKLGNVMHRMHEYFKEYEYKVSFKSEVVWETFKQLMIDFSKQEKMKLAQPDIYGLIQSLGWVYRFLNILNTPIPRAHVTHSSAAAFCGIPCVLAKLEYGTPFLLTEHGVYLREQYLSLSKRNLSTFLNTFLIRMIHSITTLNFDFADQVSPVCHYNTRWETKFGVAREKIDVIYNGVNKSVFVESGPSSNLNPTVVAVARIDPLKDIKTLIKASAIVKKHIPNVQFIVYGSVAVPTYYDECVALVEKLGLESTFQFAGHSDNIVSAYHSGDVIALSSVSEAFPYSVVEAMMTGKPVVATDVGGVGEAIGDTGMIVPACDEETFAASVTKLLQDANLRRTLGDEARERALTYFTQEKVLEHHMKSYLKLAIGVQDERIVNLASRQVAANPLFTEQQGLNMEPHSVELSMKGYALVANGFHENAIDHFRQAIQANPTSPAVPVYFGEIVKIYHKIGKPDIALQELERMKTFLDLNHMISSDGSTSVV